MEPAKASEQFPAEDSNSGSFDTAEHQQGKQIG
jgi:hypothetical protein